MQKFVFFSLFRSSSLSSFTGSRGGRSQFSAAQDALRQIIAQASQDFPMSAPVHLEAEIQGKLVRIKTTIVNVGPVDPTASDSDLPFPSVPEDTLAAAAALDAEQLADPAVASAVHLPQGWFLFLWVIIELLL